MTYVPARMLELQRYMQRQTGLPLSSLGVYPDESHDGGYHCGWDRRRIRNGQLSDYSWQESSRDFSHKTDAARAFDCGRFDRLRELSVWMVGECERGALDTRDIRSIIYSPDGISVLRWDRLKLHAGGSVSHRTHTHFSFFADAETHDKVSPFRRFFEGGGMPTEGERNQSYMIQNGLVGVEEPVLHIPAESGFPPVSLSNPFATALKALVEGKDAQMPAFANIPARTWRNAPAERLARMEAKLNDMDAKLNALLARPPGSVDTEAIRAVVRQELDSTKLGVQ